MESENPITRKVRRFFLFPFYPFLLVSHFFLHIYAVNIGERPPLGPFFAFFGLSLAVTLGIFLLLWLWTRRAEKSAFLTGVGVLLFFSYGIVEGVLHHQIVFKNGYLFVVDGIILLAAFWLATKKGEWLKTSSVYFNAVTLILLAVPLFSILSYSSGKQSPAGKVESPAQKISPKTSQEGLPDIYYIILDEYPRADALKRLYHYDNQEFLKFLESVGFVIAQDSHANYMRTRYSLASSMNMMYLDFLTPMMKDSADMGILYKMIYENNVAQKLKSIGYRYVIVDSGSPPTDKSPLMDIQITYTPTATREMHLFMANMTPLRDSKWKFLLESLNKRYRYGFEELAKVPDIEGPTYTLAHVILPHPPFVFDRNGGVPPKATMQFSTEDTSFDHEDRQLFLDQLIYLNQLMKTTILALIQKSSPPPVIIIQSDTGPTPPGEPAPTKDYLSERTSIFNAYLLPPRAREKLYPSISPVNSFRIVFDGVFQQNMGLLEDKIYFHHPKNHPYQFLDVTQKVKEIENDRVGTALDQPLTAELNLAGKK